ncbi:MAG: lysophospholipid acyltransferase family protein [Pyrinomonadaceae bacterium]
MRALQSLERRQTKREGRPGLVGRDWAATELKCGTGVPPVNHAQDARATSKSVPKTCVNDIVTVREKSPKRSLANESVLPQWAIDLMRPVVRAILLACWKVRLTGLENIPLKDGVIIASNHQSYIDPFVISIPINRPLRFLAWNVALDWPLVGKIMKLLGAWPLQLEGSDPAAIRRSLQWLRDGEAVVIFPEGGRGEPDGSMVTFKAGAVRIALEAGVPILPVTIRGANRVWPPGKRIPRPGEIEIVYHPLFRPELLPDEDSRACARRESEQLASVIRSAL